MSVFTKVPAIDWLKDMADNPPVGLGETAAARLPWLYKYLLWSFRYQCSDPKGDEHKVALGMLTKYHRKLYNIPPTPFERTKLIPEAEALRKKMLADAKKAKHA